MQLVPRIQLDHPATYQDLLELPDTIVAEIVDDELYASPRPAPRHAWTNSVLIGLLLPVSLQNRGAARGWIVLTEPELHLQRDVLVPDLAAWRRSRMSRLPDTAFFPLAPDWVCEVLSPSTASIDRGKKLGVYARERVSLAWLVDPLARSLEVLRLEGHQWTSLTQHRESDVVRVPPFEDVEIPLGRLWDETAGFN